ncbi:hypothetical protein F4804DRAFT_305701 [Jackrogersella minutella]|nr:hypothetical protein F4804DRAFT_305701 [Jackrogersella minutella]
MSEQSKPRMLIIGAGSMGVLSGYILSLAGVDVTFLVRPHHAERLGRPQILYCYNDNSLKEYTGYTYITDPSDMVGANYDYILITLDAASLRNETGVKLVKTIGEAARETNTKIVLGVVFFDILSWFLQVSGLAAEQVTNGHLDIHVYGTKDVTLPVHAPTDPESLAKSDFAYIDQLGSGFTVDDSSLPVAKGFTDLWNASGVSRGSIKSSLESALSINPLFPVFAACELLGWPRFQDIDTKGEIWKLVIASVKEIQELSIHGELGQQAAKLTTEESFTAALVGWEKAIFPLDLQEFNRFHHGKKVKAQGRQHLRACLAYGAAEGKPMPALKELVQRAEDNEVLTT